MLSNGGLYVGGGIAPRILEKLKDGTFMKAFTDKGRLSEVLINMPVRIILESQAALLGAAAYAEARAIELTGIRPTEQPSRRAAIEGGQAAMMPRWKARELLS